MKVLCKRDISSLVVDINDNWVERSVKTGNVYSVDKCTNYYSTFKYYMINGVSFMD